MAEEQHTGDESDNAMPTPKDAMGPHGLGTDDPERDWKAEYEKAMAERDKLVAQSRKWEERAKANKAKADKADQMEVRYIYSASLQQLGQYINRQGWKVVASNAPRRPNPSSGSTKPRPNATASSTRSPKPRAWTVNSSRA